jgi:hypothetical protein
MMMIQRFSVLLLSGQRKQKRARKRGREEGKERDKEGDLFLFLKFSFCFKMSYHYGAFTLDVKSVVNENVGGILGGTHC